MRLDAPHEGGCRFRRHEISGISLTGPVSPHRYICPSGYMACSCSQESADSSSNERFVAPQYLLVTEKVIVSDGIAAKGIPMKEKRQLRIGEVIRKTGLSKSEIYRRVKERKFPQQTRISHRIAVWPEASVDAWLEAQA